jgi:4-amino-4-deoxy-L-arabinose transferase-like glycosyltransferase
LAASAALALYLGWRSWSWPLIHDAPLMHYVAWLVTQGAVPYRDVFDMNVPGVYLLHLGVISLLGEGDRAWRLFDLAWLGLTAAALFGFSRRMGDAWSGLGAALLFVLYHLSGGAWRAGQRDFLLALFLVLAAWGAARAWESGGALSPLAWGGLAAGAGIMIKPQAALFWVACAAVSAAGARRSGALRALAVWCAAGLAVPVLVMGWIAWRGGLGPFRLMFVDYVLPLYSRVGRVSVWEGLRWHVYGWQIWSCLIVLGVLGLSMHVEKPYDIRRKLALLGAVYGFLHFAVQAKGWEYHLYPFAVFLCALASVPLAARAKPAQPARWSATPALSRSLTLAVLLIAVALLGIKGVDAADAPWIADKANRVSSLTRDLAHLVGPGASVQVMDVTEGGIHALLRLHSRQPTRFLYDFHFFHDEGDPRIQSLRAEFARDVERGRPAAVVVFRDTWRRRGYERLKDFPAVDRLLTRDYTLAVEGDGYRIYAQRCRS